jgi:hypothetical protein
MKICKFFLGQEGGNRLFNYLACGNLGRLTDKGDEKNENHN